MSITGTYKIIHGINAVRDPVVNSPSYKSHFIASRREYEARQLDDTSIHKKVILNIIQIPDLDIYTKAQFLLESMTDLGLLFHILQVLNIENIISETTYGEILELMYHLMKSSEAFYEATPYVM